MLVTVKHTNGTEWTVEYDVLPREGELVMVWGGEWFKFEVTSVTHWPHGAFHKDLDVEDITITVDG